MIQKDNHPIGLGRFVKIFSTRPTNLLDVCLICLIEWEVAEDGYEEHLKNTLL
jgi:hypothetical protein